jgi:hypothetical protein
MSKPVTKYKVFIVDEDGDKTEQGIFDTKEEAFTKRRELIGAGFDYVAVFQVTACEHGFAKIDLCMICYAEKLAVRP